MIVETIKALKEGEVDIRDRVFSAYEKIKKENKKINAFITLVSEEDLEKQIERVKEKIKKGHAGRLAGLMVAVKDNFTTEGLRTTCASKMLENYIPPYNATVIERILAEDAIIIGKSNMDEFACGSDGTTSYFGPTKNPHDLSRVPGGSSSGSAAALAAKLVDLALGSDTGGSIRCPSSFCGIYGLKPTYGLISRYGLIDMAMSLDCPGPMANDLYGLALLLEVIAGKDDKDCATFSSKTKKYVNFVENGEKARNLKVGVIKEFIDSSNEEIRQFFEEFLKNAKFKYEIVSMPVLKYAVPIYYLVVFSEFSSAMAKYDGLKYGRRMESKELFELVSRTRSKCFGKEVKRRILLGTYITLKEYKGKWYTKAFRARALIKETFDKAFGKYDILLGPTMPCLPWKIGEKADPVDMYYSDILTTPASLAGICALSMPIGMLKKLPVGLQIMANKFEEDKVLMFASFLESQS